MLDPIPEECLKCINYKEQCFTQQCGCQTVYCKYHDKCLNIYVNDFESAFIAPNHIHLKRLNII